MTALRRSGSAIALAGAAIWLHHDILMGRRYFFRDTTLLYAPAKFFLARLLREGILPQWWPWDGAGAPMLAQPIFSTFHPTTLLYVLLPFWRAFAAQDVSATAMALGGTYFLARALKQSRFAALVAAIFFAANGYVIGLTEHQFMKLSAATMPWYWCALVEADRRRGYWFLAPAVMMGLLLIAGDPQIAILTAAGGAAVLLSRQPTRRNAVLAFASPIAGAALAAIQLLPSMLLADQTERSQPLLKQDSGHFDLAHAVGLFVPVDAGGFAPNVVVGLACAALLGASLVSLRRRRFIGALWLLVVLSLWLSIGDQAGLNVVARHVVPLWDKFRYPIKSLVLGMLAAALLVGDGFIQLSHHLRGRRALLTAGAMVVTSMAFTVIEVWIEAHSLVGIRWPLAASILGAGIVLAASYRRLRLTVAVVASAQILWFGSHVLPTIDASFYDEPPIAEALRAHGVGLTGPGFERVDLDQYPLGETPLHVAAGGGGQNSSYGAFFDLPSLSFYTPGTSSRLEAVLSGSFDMPDFGRLLGTYGIGYVVLSTGAVAANAALDVGGGDPIPVKSKYGDQLIPLRRTLARAYAVHRGRAVSNAKAARTEILSAAFKPGREVLIESDERLDSGARSDELSVPTQITRRTNTSVTVDADLPWPGFVVLNESWFKGWTATVDDHDAPVFIANGFVRAVDVPKGHHEVTFQFQTPGLRAGFALSVCTWAIVAVAFLLLWRRRAGAVR